MSVLLSIGEANHRLLNADTELGALQVTSTTPSVTEALIRARQEIAEVRAIHAAIRLVLNSPALPEMLAHHQDMASKMRMAAKLARLPARAGFHNVADAHDKKAKALLTLIGPKLELVPPPAAEGGRE